MESDQPIKNSTEDRFGRWSFAQRIAQTVANRQDIGSVVIGIHAAWGEGKTSVLNMISEELSHHSSAVVVRFNPWRFPDEIQLLHRFFSTLAGTFDASLETRAERLSALVNKYAEVVSPIPVGGKPASGFLKAFTSERQADLEELKIRIERILKNAGKRVVVFMDDIDRLDENEVQAVFRLVKLSADFPNTAYILAFDETRVAEALAEQYGSVEAGRAFLEKIIQVPLSLPRSRVQPRRALAVEGIESALQLAKIELTTEQKQRFADVFDKAFLRRIATPRIAKRFANGLTFTLPIVSGEVNPVDVILIEGVRTFYPKLYTSIRDNEEVYLGNIFDVSTERRKKEARTRAAGVIDKALEGLGEEDKQAAKVVIQELFPRTGTSGMFGPGAYGPEYGLVWAKNQRIASKDYFHRYFNYGVPSDDISDQELKQFLDKFKYAGGWGRLMTDEVEKLATNNRADTLIRKLRQYEDELPANMSAPLAEAIASSGRHLPQSHPTDRFFGLGAYAQASALIRHLIQNISEERERNELAIKIAGFIEPLPFALDYSRWMRPLKRSQESDQLVPVVSNECETTLSRIIALRIASEAKQMPLEKKYPLDAQGLYQFWAASDTEGIRAYLEQRLKARPAEVVAFLAAVLGVSDEPKSEDLSVINEQDWYDAIARMVEPKTITMALRVMYPNKRKLLSTPSQPKTMILAERVARWFVGNYEKRNGSNDSLATAPNSDSNAS